MLTDTAERDHRILRLAEKFFFAPENVARRQMLLGARGWRGSEEELWVRGGERTPIVVALERVVEWFPKLLDSGGTRTIPLWKHLVEDWHRDWKQHILGSKSHPKLSLDAPGLILGGQE